MNPLQMFTFLKARAKETLIDSKGLVIEPPAIFLFAK
jgi:hypothetical protein